MKDTELGDSNGYGGGLGSGCGCGGRCQRRWELAATKESTPTHTSSTHNDTDIMRGGAKGRQRDGRDETGHRGEHAARTSAKA